jgi:hypothetical protein
MYSAGRTLAARLGRVLERNSESGNLFRSNVYGAMERFVPA